MMLTNLPARALLLVMFAWSGVGTVMAIEEPGYAVVEKSGDFELRMYEPFIVAETVVDGTFDDVGSEAFDRLGGYIFGNNRSRTSIDMTAPVTQTPASERIAMTAPVSQTQRDGEWRVTFTMPAGYTMQTLPEPIDTRVLLKQQPGRLVAAIRYSGTWARERYQAHERQLASMIAERGLRPVGDPIFARYNSPFSLWFLRRNEVLIPVERQG